MHKLAPLALMLGVFVGCYSTLDSFSHRLAKLSCINTSECQAEAFKLAFDSIPDCTDEVGAELDEFFAPCTYDPKRGRQCIHAVYRIRKDCSMFYGAMLPECEGAVFCPESVQIEAVTARFVPPNLVAPLADAPRDAIPLD